MGVEARYQAIPEDCELVVRARKDRELAELMEFFNGFATGRATAMSDPLRVEVIAAAKALAQTHPGLSERYFSGSRRHDQVLYLLSPARRARQYGEKDGSLIRQAIYGIERLHPEAASTQGFPIGFVPADDVQRIAEYLSTVDREMLHEHYDPPKMSDSYVYKTDPGMSEAEFEWIWEEFEGMRRVYGQAAAHGEAMITVID